MAPGSACVKLVPKPPYFVMSDLNIYIYIYRERDIPLYIYIYIYHNL